MNDNSGPLSNDEFKRIMGLFTPKKERQQVKEEPADVSLQGNPRLLVIQDILNLTQAIEILVVAWNEPPTKEILDALMQNTDVQYPFSKPIEEIYRDVSDWKNSVIENLSVRSN